MSSGVSNKWNRLLPIIGLACVLLSACDETKSASSTVQKWATVYERSVEGRLHYQGTIRPIALHAVSSQVDGYALVVPKRFGVRVEQGSPLFEVSAPKAEKAFRESLIRYLKDKDAYDTGQKQLKNDALLFKEGIISKNAFDSRRSKLEAQYLQTLQDQTELTFNQKLLGIQSDLLTQLHLHDQKRLQTILGKLHHVTILAPQAGSLLPINGMLELGAKAKRIEPGSKIEHGQILTYIANTDGVMVEVTVNEHDVVRVKKGLRATITGEAFPGVKLKGIVQSVDLYGIVRGTRNGSVSAKFPIRIVVEHLTAQQKKQIKPGMSALVTLHLPHVTHVLVPIPAVHIEDGRYFVLKRSGSLTQKTPVLVGATTREGVAILSGLKAGDQVAVSG